MYDEEQLRLFLGEGFQSRRTEATEKNDTSSRSHMIVRISIENMTLTEADQGVLCLVDLAGNLLLDCPNLGMHDISIIKKTRICRVHPDRIEYVSSS